MSKSSSKQKAYRYTANWSNGGSVLRRSLKYGAEAMVLASDVQLQGSHGTLSKINRQLQTNVLLTLWADPF